MRPKELELELDEIIDCELPKAFWCVNSSVCHNIYDLLGLLVLIDDYSFKYHVNQDNNKNDFAKWLREVINENDLAGKLENIYDKEQYIRAVENHILPEPDETDKKMAEQFRLRPSISAYTHYYNPLHFYSRKRASGLSEHEAMSLAKQEEQRYKAILSKICRN